MRARTTQVVLYYVLYLFPSPHTYLSSPSVRVDSGVDGGAVLGRGDLEGVELSQEVLQALRRGHLQGTD